MLCSKIKLNIKEKITGLGLWEPIPKFSGVNIRAKKEKRIKSLIFIGKKVEKI